MTLSSATSNTLLHSTVPPLNSTLGMDVHLQFKSLGQSTVVSPSSANSKLSPAMNILTTHHQLSCSDLNASIIAEKTSARSHSSPLSTLQQGSPFALHSHLLAAASGLNGCASLPTSPKLAPTSTPVTSTLTNLNGQSLINTQSLPDRFPANHTLHSSFNEQYELLGELGSGGYGFVYLARRRSALPSSSMVADKFNFVAVKFIIKEKIPSHNWVRDKYESNKILPLEVYVLKYVRHDSIIGFLDYFEDDVYGYAILEYHGLPVFEQTLRPPTRSCSSCRVISHTHLFHQRPPLKREYSSTFIHTVSSSSSSSASPVTATFSSSSSSATVSSSSSSDAKTIPTSKTPFNASPSLTMSPVSLNDFCNSPPHIRSTGTSRFPSLSSISSESPVMPLTPQSPVSPCMSDAVGCDFNDFSSTLELLNDVSVDLITESSSSTLLSIQTPSCMCHRYNSQAELECLKVQTKAFDLFEALEQIDFFSESQTRFVIHQVVSAVHYLHSNAICHRDIKDENVLIDENWRVRLIDFGSVAFVRNSMGSGHASSLSSSNSASSSLLPGGCSNISGLFDKFSGTVQYASPEVLTGHKYCGFAVDIWALGCLLYIMLQGEIPFLNPQEAMLGRIRPFSKQVNISPECVDLLEGMLRVDPKMRYTIVDVINHPWFSL